MSTKVVGSIDHAFDERLPEASVASIAPEYGTCSMDRVMKALIAGNWCYRRGERASAQGRAIVAELRRCFYPDEDDWKELVWVCVRQIMRRAIRGLAAAPRWRGPRASSGGDRPASSELRRPPPGW